MKTVELWKNPLEARKSQGRSVVDDKGDTVAFELWSWQHRALNLHMISCVGQCLVNLRFFHLIFFRGAIACWWIEHWHRMLEKSPNSDPRGP